MQLEVVLQNSDMRITLLLCLLQNLKKIKMGAICFYQNHFNGCLNYISFIIKLMGISEPKLEIKACKRK